MQNRLAHVKIAGGQQRVRSGVQIADDSPPPDAPLPIDVFDPRLDALRAPKRPESKEPRKVLPVIG